MELRERPRRSASNGATGGAKWRNPEPARVFGGRWGGGNNANGSGLWHASTAGAEKKTTAGAEKKTTAGAEKMPTDRREERKAYGGSA
ncbi:hypothetical protein FB389_0114 [Rarobacter incanus]|uniref:Uncharacterized protein n=1 Tax=Rarobacter incanus TaxID=153494 RepID=A0A542SMK8_9MICO|nr:hypothetical protein FB389_0114 [Rarobacter incanus]